MLRILDIYPSQTSSLEDNSKAMVLQTLQTEHDLFSLVLTQFKEFKASVLAGVPEPVSPKSIDAFLADSDTYINHVKLRFQVFEFMISHQPFYSQHSQILGIEEL